MRNVTQTVKHAYEVEVTIPVVFRDVVVAANKSDAGDVAIERALEFASSIDFVAEQDDVDANYVEGFTVDVQRVTQED